MAKRPEWLPGFTRDTLSAVLAGLIVVALAAWDRARDLVADVVRWLADPVDTPRVVFLFVLFLAALGGAVLLIALGRWLLGRRRDSPSRQAEKFRSDWEKLADNLRQWESKRVRKEEAPARQERYRDLRREVIQAYEPVQEDFARFLEANPDWDLREPIPVELAEFDVEPDPIDQPFRDLWRENNLPAAIRRVEDMGAEQFAAWYGQRSDALNAFVTSVRRR